MSCSEERYKPFIIGEANRTYTFIRNALQANNSFDRLYGKQLSLDDFKILTSSDVFPLSKKISFDHICINVEKDGVVIPIKRPVSFAKIRFTRPVTLRFLQSEKLYLYKLENVKNIEVAPGVYFEIALRMRSLSRPSETDIQRSVIIGSAKPHDEQCSEHVVVKANIEVSGNIEHLSVCALKMSNAKKYPNTKLGKDTARLLTKYTAMGGDLCTVAYGQNSKDIAKIAAVKIKKTLTDAIRSMETEYGKGVIAGGKRSMKLLTSLQTETKTVINSFKGQLKH